MKRPRLQPPPWAMAAIAMLAVGIGVWTIPRQVQFEGDAAPADTKYAEDVLMAEEMLGDEDEAREGRVAEAELASEETAPLATLERADSKSKRGAPEPAHSKRRSRSSVNEPRAARVAQAPASLPAADVAAAGAGESQSNEMAAKASAPSKQERGAEEMTATCQRKIDELERRTRADKEYAPSPEEKLAIGKCYQALDKVAEARRWLERAAAHRKTKAAAEKALRELAAK